MSDFYVRKKNVLNRTKVRNCWGIKGHDMETAKTANLIAGFKIARNQKNKKKMREEFKVIFLSGKRQKPY